MSAPDRDVLITVLAELAHREADIDHPYRTFLPLPAHRRALRDEIIVIHGGRGAGKTALFRIVNQAKDTALLRTFFEEERIPEATWLDAFSVHGQLHPDVGTLEAVGRNASDVSLRAFWMAHLYRRLQHELPDIVPVPAPMAGLIAPPAADVMTWLAVAESNSGAVTAALDATERALESAGRTVVASYDYLDRIGQIEPEVRRRYIRALLALWLSFSTRYRRLRGKVFLRDDLFEASELQFADATKLRARAQSIDWDAESLLRVVVRHLATESEPMRGWLGDVPGLTLRDRGELGWTPNEMPDEVQRAFVARVAGKVIGKGVLKGYTHTWILGRLRDSLGHVTPRSMLRFFGFAGEEAQRRKGDGRRTSLVSSEDLLVALQRTSSERVEEIREDYPLVRRIESLRGMTLPIDRDEALRRLAMPAEGGTEANASGDVVLQELARLGVLEIQEDGRVNVPDIYRYSFDIAPRYAEAWEGFLQGKQGAIREFQRELPILKEILKRGGFADQFGTIGQEELTRGDLEGARSVCERALDLARSSGDLKGEADLWLTMGRTSKDQKDYARARTELEQAVAVARRAHDLRKEARARFWLASTLLIEGNNAVAEASLRVALATSIKAKEDVYQSLSAICLAISFRTLGRLDEAAQLAEQALHAGQKLDPPWEDACLSEIARIAESKGRPLVAFRAAAVAARLRGAVASDHPGDPTRLRDDLARKLGITPEQVSALTEEAARTYAEDRGKSLLDAIRPRPATSAS